MSILSIKETTLSKLYKKQKQNHQSLLSSQVNGDSYAATVFEKPKENTDN